MITTKTTHAHPRLALPTLTLPHRREYRIMYDYYEYNVVREIELLSTILHETTAKFELAHTRRKMLIEKVFGGEYLYSATAVFEAMNEFSQKVFLHVEFALRVTPTLRSCIFLLKSSVSHASVPNWSGIKYSYQGTNKVLTLPKI